MTDTQEFTWRIEQGETETISFPVSIGSDPLDVTGWSVDAKVKANPGGPVLYTFPAEHIEIAATGGGGSTVTLRVPASVSVDWDFVVGWYRVKITDPDSPVDDPVTYRVLQGPLLVDPD